MSFLEHIRTFRPSRSRKNGYALDIFDTLKQPDAISKGTVEQSNLVPA